MANRKYTPRICEYCGTEFQASVYDVKIGRGRCCSRSCAMHLRPRTIKPLTERFWSKVDKTSHPNGCWIWTGSRGRRGYGNFAIIEGKGVMRSILAHRLSYELANGEFSDDLCVLHKCDNPPCVNPDHLFLGTRYDNVQDMRAKGRQRYIGHPGSSGAQGEHHGNSKLTNETVRHIRALHKNGLSYSKLATQFSVNKSTIERIVLRKSWTHIE